MVMHQKKIYSEKNKMTDTGKLEKVLFFGVDGQTRLTTG
jgi:hypothetical protein